MVFGKGCPRQTSELLGPSLGKTDNPITQKDEVKKAVFREARLSLKEGGMCLLGTVLACRRSLRCASRGYQGSTGKAEATEDPGCGVGSIIVMAGTLWIPMQESGSGFLEQNILMICPF